MTPDSDQLTRDHHWLQVAVDLSRRCPPSTTAFSVGAVVVDGAGHVLADGYSRDTDEWVHAEESAINKLAGPPMLAYATLYSSLEPCSVRKSRSRSCTQLILASGIQRVVFALREPVLFVDGQGSELLQAAGISVVEMTELADQVRDINARLLGDDGSGLGGSC